MRFSTFLYRARGYTNALSLNIKDNDFLFCHQITRICLAKGMSSKFMFAELYGKISGSTMSKGSQDIRILKNILLQELYWLDQ